MIGIQEGMIPLMGLGAANLVPFEPFQVSLSILLLIVGLLVALLLPFFAAAWAHHLVKGRPLSPEGQDGLREEPFTPLSPPRVPLSTLSDEELDALITFMRWRGSHPGDPTPPPLKRGEALQRWIYPSLPQ